jgi:putative Holliday junction resolvase
MAGRVLGLDVGDARIGVAVGEVGLGLAFGRGVITRTNLAQDVAAVQALCRQEQTDCVVVGLPRLTDGSESRQADKVRTFAAALERSGLAVTFEDERFTTRLAAQELRRSGLNKTKRQEKGRQDEAAAVLILESYLTKTLMRDRID